MRKIFLITLISLFLLFMFNNGKGENEKIVIKLQKGNRTIYINDEQFQMDVAPIEVPPGRIMVPIRFISEAFGASLYWDQKIETVTITIDSIPYLKYEISNLKALLNEKEKKINELTDRLNERIENIYFVKRVIDGDTFELENGLIVRYIGINAPEQGQTLYEKAKLRNKELVEGKKVKLEFDNLLFDQFGRLLSYVFVDNIFVNYQLLKEGYAIYEKIYPNKKYCDKLIEAENFAKDNKIGIWKESNIKLKIVNINYDAEGDDNENLNGEWVVIKNVEIMPVNMKDFTLRDITNHIFIFPEIIIYSNETVYIYTGCGENSYNSLYWCSNKAIWNNDFDTAFLYDPFGNLIDTYNYP